ncbi:voltage-dependent anion channel [Calycina marina]|uniref:Voltage-dependent anion channel n=1 Tax=Calycina marina TaxID=1763456 RepID=A0A9P7YWE1_9HELO|nr:voltage-dependent anion channel [Calycina marina]
MFKQEDEEGNAALHSLNHHHGWKRRVRHFTWNWFASTMSTGAIAVVLTNTPYKFAGLKTIGSIFFILDIIMFLGASILLCLRFSLRPASITKSLHLPKEALFFGAFWVSIALILNCTQAYGVPSCGPWLVTALRVCFWIYATLVFIVAVSQYATLFVKERMPTSQAMPALILPIYPFLVLGSLAATLAPSQSSVSGIQMLVAGILFQGLGWMVSIFMYTIYMLRLMSHSLPEPSNRPGMFISVGPAGYTSAAFVALGLKARDIIPADFLGVYVIPAGEVLRIIGIVMGIFLWLLAFWFFCVTLWSVIEGVRDMSFTLTWWAFIFPNDGLTLATIEIGNALESHGIKIVASIMTALLVIMWLFVTAACMKALWQRKVLWPGKDEDKNMEV